MLRAWDPLLPLLSWRHHTLGLEHAKDPASRVLLTFFDAGATLLDTTMAMNLTALHKVNRPSLLAPLVGAPPTLSLPSYWGVASSWT